MEDWVWLIIFISYDVIYVKLLCCICLLVIMCAVCFFSVVASSDFCFELCKKQKMQFKDLSAPAIDTAQNAYCLTK